MILGIFLVVYRKKEKIGDPNKLIGIDYMIKLNKKPAWPPTQPDLHKPNFSKGRCQKKISHFGDGITTSQTPPPPPLNLGMP